ncbi:plastocyanin/azurin family copper-binding protein [Halomarina oriensis]|uniref:Halocyanin n=1 Tax=Halomarina oriensis TaxID=671145 RepID=A0A6B0GIP5_9EURY|nr:plastocyanin/azurin family copper-binding protein [Halomarina oriensis]MWG33339.1 halocyanin [Halomarina oriensis]
MTDETGMKRRDFLRAAGVGGAVAAGAAGTAAGQEGNGSGTESGGGGGGGSGPIDYGIEGANGYDGPGSGTDATGQSEVSIAVGVGGGGYAFGPAAVNVDPGTTITWEWESAGHNVNAQSGAEFESPLQSEGTFEWTVPDDASGIVEYQCDPHVGQGMIGALAIGSDVPRAAPAGPVEPVVADSAKTLGIATLIAMFSTLGLAFFFLKYGGDYE